MGQDELVRFSRKDMAPAETVALAPDYTLCLCCLLSFLLMSCEFFYTVLLQIFVSISWQARDHCQWHHKIPTTALQYPGARSQPSAGGGWKGCSHRESRFKDEKIISYTMLRNKLSLSMCMTRKRNHQRSVKSLA